MTVRRREQYRIGLNELQEVSITMRTPDGARIECDLGDISFGGVGLSVNIEANTTQRESLRHGDEVEFEITSTRVDEPLVLGAHVVHRTIGEGRIRYGFLFSEHDQLESFEPQLYRIFNRRMFFRIQPHREHPITATVTDRRTAEVVNAQLVDVSEGGIGVAAIVSRDLELNVGDSVQVQFELWSAEHPLNLIGTVRSRQSDSETHVRIGIEFDWSETPYPMRQQQALHHYVMDRQREILRGGR